MLIALQLLCSETQRFGLYRFVPEKMKTARILQKLASSDSTSQIVKLVYKPFTPTPSASLKEALQLYLESSSATIHSFELVDCAMTTNEFSAILESLQRNTLVDEFVFDSRETGSVARQDQDSNKYINEIANLLRNKPNLELLCMY